MKNRKLYECIVPDDSADGGIYVGTSAATNADMAFVKWHEVDTPTKLLARLDGLARTRWMTAWPR